MGTWAVGRLLLACVAVGFSALACGGSEAESACGRYEGAEQPRTPTGSTTFRADVGRTGHHITKPLRAEPHVDFDSFAWGATASEDTVFLASGSLLCALHQGQEQIWSVSLGDRIQPATLTNNTVYVPSSTGPSTRLTALAADTGEEIWAWDQPHPREDEIGFISIPVVADGAVFVNGSEGLFAFDGADGTLLWSNDFASFRGTPGLPAYGDGKVFSLGKFGLYALEPGTGEIRWLVEDLTVPAPGFSLPPVPVYGDGIVYITASGGVRAFKAQDGEELWVHETVRSSVPPALAEGTLFAIGNELAALDARTGSVRWRVPAPDDQSFSALPSVAGGVLFTATDQELFAFDAERGEELWRHDLIVDRQVLEASPPSATLPPKTPVDINLDSALLLPYDGHLYVFAENPDADPNGVGFFVLTGPNGA